MSTETAGATTAAQVKGVISQGAAEGVHAALQDINGRIAALGIDPMFLAAGVAILAAFLVMTLLIVLTRRTGGDEYAMLEEVLERLERLEASRDFSPASKLAPEIKGTVGYFKQELTDLRTILVGMSQQMNAMEQTVGALEYRLNERLPMRKGSALSKKQDANFLRETSRASTGS